MVKNLWAVSFQAALIAALAMLVELVSSKATTLFRYWLWLIVLMRLIVPFDIASPLPVNNIIGSGTDRLLSDIRTTGAYRAISSETGRVVALITGGDNDANELKTFEPQVNHVPAMKVNCYALAWFSLSSLLLCLVVTRILYVRRLLNRSSPVVDTSLTVLISELSRSLDINRKVKLFHFDTDEFYVPATFGILRPRIFLPKAMSEFWPVSEIKPILLHELAHVKRFDILVNYIQIIVQAIYFFNPFVWYINSRIRALREEICDDIAVHSLGGDRLRYSKSILSVMESVTVHPSLCCIGLGLGISRRKGSIGRRIRRILHSDYSIKTRLPVASLITLCIIGISGIVFAGAQSSRFAGATTNITQQQVKTAKKRLARMASLSFKNYRNADNADHSLLNLSEAIAQYTIVKTMPLPGITLEDRQLARYSFRLFRRRQGI